MAKAGDEYQDIVGLVREALDPGAVVKTGQWVEGPDGRRDMDVEVRGTHDGKEQFVLIECKDWKRTVGIGTVDALESKRRDLGADIAAIYSNSGFTQPAQQKARRVGIKLFSALKASDDRIKMSFYRQIVATAYSVDNYSIRLFFEKGSEVDLPIGWTPKDVYYSNCPLVNYLQNESLELLKNIDSDKNILLVFSFRQPEEFLISSQNVKSIGMEILMKCKKKYVAQEIEENVTLGHYDFFDDNMAIPDKESYIIGNFSQDKWEEVDLEKYEVKEAKMKPNSFSLGLTLYKPIAGIKDACVPSINELIQEKDVKYEDNSC